MLEKDKEPLGYVSSWSEGHTNWVVVSVVPST